ncbi:hypothetical protein [Pseudonocardia acaciae]|uniref:hypothetical protein n=1 Tax=Pseudonocardia acaciae TaxID=551276 RepID=UPI0012EE24D4|nr:hypothetical protein [Pseudonocardia acaciae]
MNAVLTWLLRLSRRWWASAREALAVHVARFCLALLGAGRLRPDGRRAAGAVRESAGSPDSPRGPPRWCPA